MLRQLNHHLWLVLFLALLFPGTLSTQALAGEVVPEETDATEEALNDLQNAVKALQTAVEKNTPVYNKKRKVKRAARKATKVLTAAEEAKQLADACPRAKSPRDECFIKRPLIWLEHTAQRVDPYELCIDMTQSESQSGFFPTGQFAIQPNQALVVHVRHAANNPVTVSVDGDVGLSSDQILGAKNDESQGVDTVREGKQPNEDFEGKTWSSFSFSAFTSASIDLTIEEEIPHSIGLTEESKEQLRTLRTVLYTRCNPSSNDSVTCNALKELNALPISTTVVSGSPSPLSEDFEDFLGDWVAETTDPSKQLEPESVSTFLDELAAFEGPPPRLKEHTILQEQTYVGVFRFGISVITPWLEHSNPIYDAEIMPGTDTLQIVQTAEGKWDSEFVLTYSHYLRPVGITDNTFKMASTFGLGLANLTSKDIDFGSFYLGLDIGWRQLSVAPTFVLQKTAPLADGMTIGAQVEQRSDILLMNKWVPGFAIIINAPLDLMKIHGK